MIEKGEERESPGDRRSLGIEREITDAFAQSVGASLSF